MKKIVFAFFSLLIICGCAGKPENTLTQISTIDALLAGSYDGQMSCAKLMDYGDTGIGTFDKLDGEMIILDGKIYQAKSDGKIYCPEMNMTTPLAAVVFFKSDKNITLTEKTGFGTFIKSIEAAVPNKNIFCAIKAKGFFSKMKVRSVPAQKKPYPPLVKVTAKQPVFNLENVSGTIVGFRNPPFVKGINVPGYHLHFISDDRQHGGHILDFTMNSGEIQTDSCNCFYMILPEDSKDFEKIDLSIDRTKELEKAEK
ncbi:MAG: alpha-acetolactate decarboxylase [Lentisphaerae bacterium GWF2_44_16]|nr:MAG: alpha-acetolactate decarboxylase [Lentisphaerae bacterium GWF2_44_16]